MNIAQAILHLFPQASPLTDFEVRHDGPTPVLREGVDGRTRYEIRPLEEGETEEVEGVHFRLVVNFNNLVEGVDYEIIDSGPYIAAWNIDAPEPTVEELQAAWEDLNTVSLEQYKQDKIYLLSGYRDEELTAGFTSTVTREGVFLSFGYSEMAQKRFTKQGAILGVNLELDEIQWQTTNVGFVILTRDEFISIMNSGAEHEIGIEFKFLYAEASIINAEDKEQVDTIVNGW